MTLAAVGEAASGLWWLWLGIAGALPIAIAATYERRIEVMHHRSITSMWLFGHPVGVMG